MKDKTLDEIRQEHDFCFCHATEFTCNVGILLSIIDEKANQ